MNRSRENGSSVYQRSCIFVHATKKNHAPCKDLDLCSSQTKDERQKRLNLEDVGLAICLLPILSPPFSRLHAPSSQPPALGQSTAAVNASQKVEAKVECHTPRGQRAACTAVESCERRGFEAMLN